MWCRLGCPFLTRTGSTPPTKDTSLYGPDYPFFKPADLNNGLSIINSIDHVSEKGFRTGRMIPSESVLVTCIGATIGKTGIIRRDGICNQQINAILPNKYMCFEFIYFQMCSSFVQAQIKMNASATTLPLLNKTQFDKLLIILPPANEQNRIAKTIIDLLRINGIIESKKQRLYNLLENTKSKILDLAIRGKLVTQNLNDEPASVLLERIQAEKEALIKQGKIKRDKNDSVIFKGDDNSYYEKIGTTVNNIDEEIPFAIPHNWKFIRLKEAWQLLSGRDLAPSEYNSTKDGIPYITGASNFSNGVINIVRWTSNPQVITKSGDLLLTCKGTVGEMAFNDFGDAHIARQIMAIRNVYNLDSEYLELCIKYYLDLIITNAKGLIPGISREDILNLILPLPPNQYQRRTVLLIKKIDTAMSSVINYAN